MPSAVYAVATMDTKGEELAFVARQLRSAKVAVTTIDVGVFGPAVGQPTVSRVAVAACHPAGAEAVLGQGERGQAVSAMGEALRAYLLRENAAGRVAGVIGLGGSGGTALIAAALQALPVGLPKLIVSTVASGNVAPYVGLSDLTIMHSVVDIAGINAVSCRILANAAHAMAGMVSHPLPESAMRPAIGLTMFGVTTPCVTAVRRALEADGFDCLVFHATGVGGRAMEKLVDSGMIAGVLDITTTEVADEVVGGVMPAGRERFDAVVRRGIPYVMSLGALDMVNFGARETIPQKFHDRLFHSHNAHVTLMRTTADENRMAARWIAGKLRRSTAPVSVLIPERGVSAIDAAGQPFHDSRADAALFDELESATRHFAHVKVRRLPLHINDDGFANALVAAFREAWLARPESSAELKVDGHVSERGPDG